MSSGSNVYAQGEIGPVAVLVGEVLLASSDHASTLSDEHQTLLAGKANWEKEMKVLKGREEK